MADAAAQPPLAAIPLVIEYVPGALLARSISPVALLTNTRPAGAAENIPALAPVLKVGVGLLADWQYGPEKLKSALGEFAIVKLNVLLFGQAPFVE